MSEPEENDSGWRSMAVRSGVCLIAGIAGWLLKEHSALASMAFYGIACLAGIWDLAQDVWKSAKEKEFGTNFLMLLVAVGAAFIGAYGEAAVLLFLFSASAAMERFAHGRTSREINALLHSAPKTANLLEGDKEREVPVSELKRGQLVRVTSGQQVPVDIELTQGESACDESSLTGEAEPVNKEVGDTAFGGTMNMWGVMVGRVLRPAEESAHQRIIRMIEFAQHLKAPVQRFTDRFGTRYTVVVVSICISAFLIWWLGFGYSAFVPGEGKSSAFYRAMTLLVVMSPCALVLSVPSAILSAIAFGARNGVLFRGGAAIENLAEVTTVAMDKTGTLTEGNLSLLAMETLVGAEADALSAAASMARLSTHPVSRSINREAVRRGVEIVEGDSLENVPGKGLRGNWRGNPVVLGSREFILEEFPSHASLQLPERRNDASETWVAGGQLLARLVLQDRLRPEARDLMSRLHEDGVKTVMLTGDRSGNAASMAKECGVSEVFSDLSPDQKVEKIQELKAKGSVAMIGDGVNDAPCLAAADVGVAMGARGSDAAIEQAEIVLMHDRLENFVLARDLSLRARRIIRENLVISLGVIVLMVITTLSWSHLPLSIGVASHEGSTVIVVMNSLRLLIRPGARQ